jgi:hypothetical protein
MALVNHRKRDFGGSADAATVELVQQSTLVDFLQESGAQGVGYLENSSEHPLGQGIRVSAFIGGPNPVPFSAGVLRIS